MPVARYFLFVGRSCWRLFWRSMPFSRNRPSWPARLRLGRQGAVRIRSDQKPPERVVYDTSLPTIVPPAVTAQAKAPAPAAVAEAIVRQTCGRHMPN